MNAILLDTDVFSYLIRVGDTRGEVYRPFIKDNAVALSFVSIAELYFWATTRKWGHKELQCSKRAFLHARLSLTI